MNGVPGDFIEEERRLIRMRNAMEQFRKKMQYYMIGRYGVDELSILLTRIAVIVAIVAIIPKIRYLAWLSWVLVAISVYRSFSKKITARSRERDWYMDKTRGIKSAANVQKRRWNDRWTHKYFRCKQCKTWVRVPRGKGKIEVTCTKCHCKVTKKT